MSKSDQWRHNLPKRSVIYQGDLEELKKEWEGKFIADGECARLPQVLTDVGHTSRWRPGPRVVDLAYLLPGTVIANFKLVDGKLKFPNQHGYHAGIFQEFKSVTLANGRLSKFFMIDQWVGNRPKHVGERPVVGYTPEEAGSRIKPCDNANEFHVVVVP